MALALRQLNPIHKRGSESCFFSAQGKQHERVKDKIVITYIDLKLMLNTALTQKKSVKHFKNKFLSPAFIK